MFMGRAWQISIGGHLLVLLLLLIGLPDFLRRDIQPPAPIPVEIVQIGPVTNTHKAPLPTPRPVPAAAPAPKPENRPTPAPRATSVGQKTSEEIEIKPKATPPPAPAEAIKPEPSKQTSLTVAEKPAPKSPSTSPEPETQTAQSDIANILKNLQNEPATPPAPSPAEETPEVPDISTLLPPNSPPLASDKLSATEMDALRRQLISCWNFPAGAPKPEELIVDVIVEVNPDRTVSSVQVVDTTRMHVDNFYRSAAEAARRAVMKCQPLELPADKYDLWHIMTIQFDPRELL